MLEKFIRAIEKIFDSNHPIYEIISDIQYIILSIWNYKIYTTIEKQQILVSNVVISIVLLLIGIKFVKRIINLLKRKLSQKSMEAGVINSLCQLAYYFLMLVMIIFVLDLSNVPLTIFTVVGTTLALGIGLGSQNIVNNFISGIIIMIEHPIKVGDIVEVKDIEGEVIHIGARCTTIKTNKNINILVPNSNILQDVVVNWTLDDTILKSSISLNIKNNIDIEMVDTLILKVLNTSKHVLKAPKPTIYLTDFNSAYYEIEVNYSIDLSLKIRNKFVVDEINRALYEAFKKNNITIEEKSNNSYASRK